MLRHVKTCTCVSAIRNVISVDVRRRVPYVGVMFLFIYLYPCADPPCVQSFLSLGGGSGLKGRWGSRNLRAVIILSAEKLCQLAKVIPLVPQKVLTLFVSTPHACFIVLYTQKPQASIHICIYIGIVRCTKEKVRLRFNISWLILCINWL